jgi:hypothetical protein
MSQNVGQVLRKHQIKITGSCRLDLNGAPVHQQQTSPTARPKAAVSVGSPQVRIVENSPRGVVLELTCPCGTQTYIQCDYASAV